MNARVLVLGALSLFTMIAVACGSDNSEFAGSSGGDGTSGSSGGTSGGFGEGGTSGSSGASGTSGGNCLAPVDMYLMLDRSGSMNEPQSNNGNKGDCNIGQTVDSKWCRAINAVSGYFNSVGATGQAAALQFFPSDSQTDALCASGDIYKIAAVPSAATVYQALPSNAFDAVLNSTTMTDGTPTEAAIRGLTRFTTANRRPGKVTIGILITDGDPTKCNTSLTALSNLLQAHNTATTVRTYVIGMDGANDDNLEEISAGGNAPTHAATVGAITNACGTGVAPCRHWNVGNGNPAAFTAALAAIQESADGCKPGGGTVNPPK